MLIADILHLCGLNLASCRCERLLTPKFDLLTESNFAATFKSLLYLTVRVLMPPVHQVLVSMAAAVWPRPVDSLVYANQGTQAVTV